MYLYSQYSASWCKCSKKLPVFIAFHLNIFISLVDFVRDKCVRVVASRYICQAFSEAIFDRMYPMCP